MGFPYLLAAGAALGGLSFLDKKKQEERELEALRQEQEFNKAVAPTVGWTGQYKGPTDYSKVDRPNAVAELGAGALGGASMQQDYDRNEAWNEFLKSKVNAAPQAVQVSSAKQMVPEGMAAQGAVSPDLGVYMSPDGKPMTPSDMAKWQAYFSVMGNRQNA